MTTTDATITVRAGTFPWQTVRLSWTPDDPFAVTMAVNPHMADAREWVFARELLVTGGGLDAHVDHQPAATVVTLDSPSGHATLKLPAAATAEFVTRVLTAMPLGTEPGIDSPYFQELLADLARPSGRRWE